MENDLITFSLKTSLRSHCFALIAGLIFCLHYQSAYAETSLRLNTTGQPPLNTEDKKGFLDLVTKEAFTRIHLQLETVQLPAERGLINSNAGIEDGEMARVGGLESLYPNLIQVPEKIMDWEFVAFSNKKINLDKGWQSLANYSVAIINGWKILEKNVPQSAELIKVKNPSQLFTLLNLKRTDIVLYEKWGGLALIEAKNMKDVQLLKPTLAEKSMYIYLHKKHEHLIKPLSKALLQIKSDNIYQILYNEILTPLAKD